MAIVIFLEEASADSGIFQMKDHIVSGLESFVRNLDAFVTKETKKAVKSLQSK